MRLCVCLLLCLLAVAVGLQPLRTRLGMRLHRHLSLAAPESAEAMVEASLQAEMPSAEIWVGSVVALVPIVWASFEFASRIRVQRQCLVCKGSGLSDTTKSGQKLSRLRKCYNCGGFLPWLGWRRFFLSTLDPGNGGVLLRPSKSYNQMAEETLKEEISPTTDVEK